MKRCCNAVVGGYMNSSRTTAYLSKSTLKVKCQGLVKFNLFVIQTYWMFFIY